MPFKIPGCVNPDGRSLLKLLRLVHQVQDVTHPLDDNDLWDNSLVAPKDQSPVTPKDVASTHGKLNSGPPLR